MKKYFLYIIYAIYNHLFIIMEKWTQKSFEWKHADEKVLHFSHPHKMQTIWEISRIVFAFLFVGLILILIWSTGIMWKSVLVFIGIMIFWVTAFSVWFKLYRAKRNYLYITSKRILFHGIRWLFKDHVRKITLDNVRNVDFQTESLLWKIFWFGTLIVQTANDTWGDNKIWHIQDAKMLTHYIDKVISLSQEERNNFAEFDASYFKNWKG